MRELLVVATGAFGMEVAGRLSANAPDGTRVTRMLLGSGPVEHAADIQVLVSSFPCPSVEAERSRAAFREGFSFLPIVYEHAHLRSGPWSLRGGSCCSDCYAKRIRQHVGADAVSDTITSHFARVGDQLGPVGTVPIWADLVAGIVHSRLPDLDVHDSDAHAQVLSIDPLSGVIRRSMAYGVDGCATCDTNLIPFEERSVSGLRHVLSKIAEVRV
jgi:hypothetical protein